MRKRRMRGTRGGERDEERFGSLRDFFSFFFLLEDERDKVSPVCVGAHAPL
jgi:hypothetical protein